MRLKRGTVVLWYTKEVMALENLLSGTSGHNETKPK